MQVTSTTLANTLPWLPHSSAPSEQHNAARAHALAHAIRLHNGSWNARSQLGRVPALLLDLAARPELRSWLATVTTQRDASSAVAELVLLDAPAGALVLLLVQPDGLPIFWCAFDIAADTQRAMAAVLFREQRVGLSDGPTDARGNGAGALIGIGQMTLPGGPRLRVLMPELAAAEGEAIALPPLVARAITIPAPAMPLRMVPVDTPQVKLIFFASPKLAQAVQRFQAGDTDFDDTTRPTYHTVTSDTRGSLEEARLSGGWRCVRMVNLRHVGPGAATITTEVVVAYRGEPAQCWPALAAALGRARTLIAPTTLIYAWFLARSAPLDDTQRLAWLPTCEALMADFPAVLDATDPEQTPSVITALDHRARSFWNDPVVAQRAVHGLVAVTDDTERRRMALVIAAGRWDMPAPTPHASCADLHPIKLTAIGAWQHLARAYDGYLLSARAQTWVGEPLQHVWRSWPPTESVPPTPQAEELARQAAAALVREIGGAWAGSIGIALPAGYSALHDLGVAEVWLDAEPGAPCAWVRLVPADGLGGLVLSFVAGDQVPDSWQIVLRWPAAVELHLLVLAVLRDTERVGIDRIIIAHPAEPNTDQPATAARPERPRGRAVLALPRAQAQRPYATPRPQPPGRRGTYGSDEEHTAIAAQVATLHGVRAHLVHYQAEHGRGPSAATRAIWAQLSPAERLLHFHTIELPPHTTVRGLKQLPDGRWSFRYQRGQYTPERAPQRIVAQGALLAAGALKIIREEANL